MYIVITDENEDYWIQLELWLQDGSKWIKLVNHINTT